MSDSYNDYSALHHSTVSGVEILTIGPHHLRVYSDRSCLLTHLGEVTKLLHCGDEYHHLLDEGVLHVRYTRGYGNVGVLRVSSTAESYTDKFLINSRKFVRTYESTAAPVLG